MYIVALDLGTTSCRALVFDIQGRVAGQESRGYPFSTPAAGHVEQDPGDLLEAADSVVQGALRRAGARAREVLGLSLSTYLHSIVALGEGGSFLTPVILWADSRSAAQVDAVRASDGWLDLHARTGCPPSTMYPLYKLAWLRQNRPELCASARRFAGIKELLIERWTGEFVVDYSIASGSGLFNLRERGWDRGALHHAGISRSQLATPVATTTKLGLTEAAAGRLGLNPGTPVVVGAGDGVLSNLGAGAIEPGVFAAMVGTSGALRTCVPEPVADPEGRVFCYYLDEGRWVLGGALTNGGIVLRWVRDMLYTPQTPYEDLISEAAGVEPGAGALLFLPYLAGERSPGFNARARGVWFGLGLEHTRAHMARAALEAVAYRLYSILGPLEESAGAAREIRATGGFARSPVWLQVCADLFGREVVVPKQTEGSALGAYILGAVALGVAEDLNTVQRYVAEDTRYRPDHRNHARYGEMFAAYTRVKAKLEDEFHALARLRGE